MSFKLTIGRTSFLDIDATHNEAIISIYPKDNIGKFFLYYYLPQVDYSNYMDRAVKGNTLNKSKIERILIPLPPLPEQRVIAHVLSTVQQAKEKTEAVISATRALKKSLMKHLFTYGPVPIEEAEKVSLKQTEIGEVPEGWDISKFGKVAKLFGGYAFRSADFVPISNTQLIRMGNLYQNSLDLDRSPIFLPDYFLNDYINYILNPEDLIISLTGTMGKEDYGFTVKIPPNLLKKLLLNQRVAKIFISNEYLIIKNFFYYFLLSRKFLNQLYKTATGTKQANLSSNAILKLDICIPSLIIQQQIASILSAVDEKLEKEENKKKALEALFKTLLHDLMTAKLRVNHLEVEA